ncbi:MAG: signal peptidase II [Alphaproteobacteria bacterium]|nr:signal peptidase II [Alphaproteobacteria bacterium]
MNFLPRDKVTREWRWGLPLVAGIIVLDQIAKAIVLTTPAFNAQTCLAGNVACGQIPLLGFFNLTMTWNHGVSFGALQAEGLARWGLFGLTSLIAVGFTVWLLRAERWMTALSLSLVIGGAVGNLVDRARFGAVVDFLDFSGLYFPWIFNVADASITVGAAFLLLDQLLAGRKPRS